MLLHAEIYNNYKNALVLGTGGGNDIVSALIVALELQEAGMRVGLAGMTSPAALHMYDGKLETPVNVIGKETKRFINPNRTAAASAQFKEISYIDGQIPELFDKHAIDIKDIYNFSTRFGTKKLQYEIEQLIERMRYDLIVAVDVGGDILARGFQDPAILSPHMDFVSLKMIKDIQTPSILVEYGLGTDGELRPEGMKELVDEFHNKDLLLYESQLNNHNPAVQKFRQIYKDVCNTRSGNTGQNTLKTLDALEKNQDLVIPYSFATQIGDQKRKTPFDITLPKEYFGKVYNIDSKRFAAERESTAFEFNNSLEQYIRLKLLQPQRKTELDTFTLRSDNDRTSIESTGVSLTCLALSYMIPKSDRTDMLNAGLKLLDTGETDVIIVRTKDIKSIPYDAYKIQSADDFTLIGSDEVTPTELGKIAFDVIHYQNS